MSPHLSAYLNQTGIDPFVRNYRPTVLPAGRCIRVKNFANFTHEIQDFPTLTMSIGTAVSGAWLAQLSGITQVGVYVPSGIDANSRIGVNEVVASGVYRECDYELTLPEPVYVPAVYINPIAVTIGTEELTPVEAVDSQALAHVVVSRINSLKAQLRKLRGLSPGWDGEHAPRFSSETIETAEQIIGIILSRSLSCLTAPKAVVGPLPDGSARFELTHKNKELFLTVSDKNVEVQRWQPLDAVDSQGLWETDARGTQEYLEWLLG